MRVLLVIHEALFGKFDILTKDGVTMIDANILRLGLFVSTLLFGSIVGAQGETPHKTASVNNHLAPMLSVQTTAPNEINLGKMATYTLAVKNIGGASAEVVVVQVALPPGAPLVDASPKPGTVEDGVARFNLGKIAVREERNIRLQFKPEKTGPIQLQARTSFATQSDTNIDVRQANLEIRCSAPLEVRYGECVEYEVTVSNTGDGVSRNVVIKPDLPSETHIDESSSSPCSLEQLAPGESQVFYFCGNAICEGGLKAIFSATDDMDQKVSTEWEVKINRPLLSVAVKGPSVRYLHRNGEYIVKVTNPGDAPATDIKVVMAVPFGLKILGTSKEAVCNKSRNILTWQLPQLTPGAEEVWSVYARADEEGRQVPQVTATGEEGLSAVGQVATDVVIRPQFFATVINRSGPVEVGEIVHFSVIVTNHGTRHADIVVLGVDLPEGLEAEPIDGVKITDQHLQFPPVSLAIGQRKEIKFKVVGSQLGEHVVRVTYGDNSSHAKLAVEGEAFFYSDHKATYVAEKPDFRADKAPRLLK